MFQIIHYFFTVHIIAVTKDKWSILFRHIYYTNRRRYIIGREPHFGADVSNMFLGRLGQKKNFCVRARNVFLASYLLILSACELYAPILLMKNIHLSNNLKKFWRKVFTWIFVKYYGFFLYFGHIARYKLRKLILNGATNWKKNS